MGLDRVPLLSAALVTSLLAVGATQPTRSAAAAGPAARHPIASDLLAVAAVPGTASFYAVGFSQYAGDSNTPVLVVQGRPGAWRPVTSATPHTSELHGVAAPSARSVWAVGLDYNPEVNNTDSLLIEHSAGGTFTQQTAPSIPNSALEAVSASSPHDAWAVGEQNDNRQRTTPLALRWRGHGWRQVALHLPTRIQAILDVTDSSAHNAWAIGYAYTMKFGSRTPHPVLLHWNGRKWSVKSAPHSRELVTLNVAASSTKHAIAAGLYDKPSGVRADYFISWNGKKWKQERPKNPGADLIGGVTMHGTTGWAVGDTINSTNGTRRPVIVEWTGSAWKKVRSPHHGTLSSLTAVAAGSPARAAAVGASTSPRTTDEHAIAFSYKPHRWSEDSVPEESPAAK